MAQDEAAGVSSVDTDEPNVEVAGAATVAATERATTFGARIKRAVRWFGWFGMKVPWFAHVLWVYVLVQLFTADVRNVFIDVGTYQLEWVEVMYLLAAMIAMSELLRVSRPGVDNTREAIFMLLVGIVFLVLFVIGATGVLTWLGMFNNTEFLMLMLISWAQVIIAFMVNARTLKRTIDYSGGGGGGGAEV